MSIESVSNSQNIIKGEEVSKPTLRDILSKLSPEQKMSADKANNQFLVFYKKGLSDEGKLQLKLTDFSVLEQKHGGNAAIDIISNASLSMEEKISQLLNKNPAMKEALDQMKGKPFAGRSEQTPAPAQNAQASSTEEADIDTDIDEDNLDIVSNPGDDRVDGEDNSFSYGAMLVDISDPDGVTIAMENPQDLTPEDLANAEVRYKFKRGEESVPITVSTHNLQIIELDKSSPMLAKAFTAMLMERGFLIPVDLSNTSKPEASQSENKESSSDTKNASSTSRKESAKQQERTIETEKKSEKLQVDSAALISISSSESESINKENRKIKDKESDRLRENIRKDVIKEDIKHTETQHIKVASDVSSKKEIKKAINSAEGVAPEKEKA